MCGKSKISGGNQTAPIEEEKRGDELFSSIIKVLHWAKPTAAERGSAKQHHGEKGQGDQSSIGVK